MVDIENFMRTFIEVIECLPTFVCSSQIDRTLQIPLHGYSGLVLLVEFKQLEFRKVETMLCHFPVLMLFP